MDTRIDVSTLSVEDVREEYLILHDKYRQMCVGAENDAQRIHELKRHLDTALAAESYLAQELEQVTSNISANSSTKVNAQLQELQREHAKLQKEFNAMQVLSDQNAEENANLTRQLEDMKSLQLNKKATDEEHKMAALAADERAERLQLLEEENLELLQKLDELQEENVRQVMQINDKENSVEMLRDRLQCVVENLTSKRNELEEKTQMLESAQEQLCEANGRIALLTAAPETAERKGNSLFAEVDDQRQVMKQLLAAQKRSYMEMKKVYQESQYEIRRLKRENIAMHNELDACSTLFCSSNKTYQSKLLQRLLHANNEKDLLERQLQLMHNRLRDLTNNKGMDWLDSMLNFCKQETDELKKQLHSSRIQQASLEEQLRNISQDMARWRFEALKSRCLLLDRENLLNSNNISFKANTAVEFRISEAETLAACPRIMSKRYSMDPIAVKPSEDVKAEPQPIIEEKIVENITKTETQTENEPISVEMVEEFSNKDEQTEPEPMTKEQIAVNINEENGLVKIEDHVEEPKINIEELPLATNENKENMAITINQQNNVKCSKRSSILSKKSHNLLQNNDGGKSVKFSQSPPTVHNLSANVNPASPTKEPALVTTKTFKPKGKNKSSLIVVRNIVFKPSGTQQQQQNNNSNN